MFHYSLYNLSVASDINIRPLAGCLCPPGAYDIRVRLGRTPATLSRKPLLKTVCTEMAENEFVFFHKSLGLRFYVKNGDEIIVDMDYYTDPDKVSVFFLGSIMGAVLYMRGWIPMHAASVITDKGAVLLTGKSGVGKSTLVFALMQRGYRIFGDDVAPVRLKDGQAMVYPGYPRLKLWKDALVLNGVRAQNYPRIRQAIEKYYVDASGFFHDQPIPAHRVIHLTTHNKSGLQVAEKIRGLERLNIIRQVTYRGEYARGLKREAVQFRICTSLAELPMAVVHRSHEPEDFTAFVNELEALVIK